MTVLEHILAALGISCVFYHLWRLHSNRHRDGYDSAASKILNRVLFVLGLFAGMAIGWTDDAISEGLYRQHIRDLKKVRLIAGLEKEPSRDMIREWNLDTTFFKDRFTYEDFRLDEWKEHEYRKLGM